MPLGPGTRLDAYELIRPLGSGGMGEVWLARDSRLNRDVAIKVLPADRVSDEDRRRRFVQEAQAASALNHPHIVTIYEIESDHGIDFIAMEYVRGKSLDALIPRSGLRLGELLRIGIAVADALAAAHAKGIVHRDLKPANVVVGTDGVIKVVDFGLAKLLASEDDSTPEGETRTTVGANVSAPGTIAGTAAYMSPEQALGEKVDARSDIFSFGAMLYEMATGLRPFQGKATADTLAAVIAAQPKPPTAIASAIPRDLEKIILRCLRREPGRRFQTMLDVKVELQELKEESDSRPSTLAPAPGPRRLWVVIGAAAVLALSAVGALYVSSRPASVPPEATDKTTVRHNLTRLTFGGGLQTDPTLSPDGRLLAYASDRAGNFDIWVQAVAGGEPVQLTREPEADTQPAWSPDGSTIVFRSEHAGGGLFLVPALGGGRRQLTTLGQCPAWSRNGREVLFQVGTDVNIGEGATRFYAVPAEGGSPTELAAQVLAHGTWKWIGEHPDGRLSAAGTHDTRGTGFYTFSRSGERLVKSNVSAVPAFLVPNNLDRFRFIWNATGTRLYAEVIDNGITNLWRVEVDPTTLAWRSTERLTTGGNDLNAALSQDGTRIAYAQQSFSFRLWSFPFDAADGRLKGEGAAFSEEGTYASHVDLSPDGSTAVYNIGRPGANRYEIWVHHFDTHQQQLLVPDGYTPKWVLGGTSILYNKWRYNTTSPDGESALMAREANGTERQLSPWWKPFGELTPAPGGSAAGHSVLVSAYDINSKDATPLWLWSLDGLSEKPEKVVIDRPRTHIWQPQLSPDGRWLAFIPTHGVVGAAEGVAPAPTRVAVAPMAKTPITEWTTPVPALSNTDKPRWAPDGRTLYFLTSRDGFYNLEGIRFDSDRGIALGRPFEVTHFTTPNLVIMPFMARAEIAISAHRAVLPMQSSTGSIWMLDNVDR